jgi:hypothetical protein
VYLSFEHHHADADTRSGGDTDFANLAQYFHGGGVFSVAMCAEMKFSRHYNLLDHFVRADRWQVNFTAPTPGQRAWGFNVH